jgi:hypothetical protein
MPFHDESWEEIEDRERRCHEDSLEARGDRIDRLTEFIREVANDTCLCLYHAGVCPSCRAKAFLKENP